MIIILQENEFRINNLCGLQKKNISVKIKFYSTAYEYIAIKSYLFIHAHKAGISLGIIRSLMDFGIDSFAAQIFKFMREIRSVLLWLTVDCPYYVHKLKIMQFVVPSSIHFVYRLCTDNWLNIVNIIVACGLVNTFRGPIIGHPN